MKGTAWGFDSRPDLDWRRFGRCAQRDADPDMWHSKSMNTVAAARHICVYHCPVMAQCLADARATTRTRRVSMVAGGVFFTEHGHEARAQPLKKTCHLCGGR